MCVENTQIKETAAWWINTSYEDAKISIATSKATIEREYIAIGFYLRHIRDNAMYQEDGYQTVEDMAKEQFGMGASAVSRAINVNKEFSREGYSPLLADDYKGYSKSLLIEMLTMEPEERQLVTPDMTVKEVREIKADLREPEPEEPAEHEIEFYYVENSEPEITPAPGPIRMEFEVGEVLPDAETQQTEPEEVATSQESEQWEELPCDTCGYDEKGYCNAPESPEEFCTMGNMWVPKDAPETGSKEVEPDLPVLPILKNNDQRKEFIDTYEKWPLWIETEETEERYYRYDLEDGNSFVVRVYFTSLFDYQAISKSYEDRFHDGWGKEEYYLLREGRHFKECETNKSAMIDHLKDLQRKNKEAQSSGQLRRRQNEK